MNAQNILRLPEINYHYETKCNNEEKEQILEEKDSEINEKDEKRK